MTFGITGNTTKDRLKDVVPGLLSWLHQKNIDYILDSELAKFLKFDQTEPHGKLETIALRSDIILAFGGDGTFLSAARAVGVSNVPILGINLGRMGFLAEVTIDEIYESLEDILNAKYTILERMVIEAVIQQKDLYRTFYALNDIVVDRGGFSRVFRVDVFIDESLLNTYLGDGIIIATPTGSTAYSLSANGPIVDPTVSCMIISPICPHSLSVRPVVIPDDSTIRIVPYVEGKIITMSVDGQVSQQFSRDNGAEITVRKAKHKIRWIRHTKRTFYDLLRTKFNWGIDKRM
ncbi:MAG TPA: NAD(+)/NADH kinase [bacterium]